MTASTRLAPLDALRGAVMIVMALDHANYFVAHAHPRPEMWAGPFPSYDSALPFLTRFATHLAAPGFFFLMGVGMTLFADSRRKWGWKDSALLRHFFIRGLILIALQLLVENRAWALRDGSGFALYFGVLYGLGAAMLAGAFLLGLNSLILIGVTIGTILATHMLLPGPNEGVPVLFRMLLVPGTTGELTVYYPLVPWLGLVTFGMLFGRWLLQDRVQAYRRALFTGALFIVSFFVIRAWGGFGNIRPAPGSDWIAFFNVVKYPPSLVFILLALGMDLILLALFARAGAWLESWGRPLVVFGSSALFFYLIHLFLYALMDIALGPGGTGIAAMYPYWILGMIILYPLCWLYGRLKHSQPADSRLRFF